MDEQQLEKEINHILESGANSIRLIELCKRYANQQVAARVWPQTLSDLQADLDKLTKAAQPTDTHVAAELVVRYNGNSRGNPIAKKAFVDAVLWIRERIKNAK